MVGYSLSVSLEVGSAESTLFIEPFALSHGSLEITQLLTTAMDLLSGGRVEEKDTEISEQRKRLTDTFPAQFKEFA